MHEKIKPFSCPIESCKTTFISKTSQKLHIEAVHEGIKPHVCTICDAKFGQKGSLTNHIKSVHENVLKFKPTTDNSKSSIHPR